MADSSTNVNNSINNGIEVGKYVNHLSDPRNKAKLFNEILSDLIAKRNKTRLEPEKPISEYARNFSNIDLKQENIEEVGITIALFI